MRFELIFYLENKIIPLDYHKTFVSFFKTTLEKYNRDVFEIVYGMGQKKNLTFATFFSPNEFTKESIILNSQNIKIILSIEDDLLGLHFMNAFLYQLNIPVNISNNIFILKSIKKLSEKKIEKNEVVFKTLSPIIIREKQNENKSWYHSFDEKGISILKQNIISELSLSFPRRYLEELEIIPIKIKKTISKFYGIKMQGNLGVIRIIGRKEILNSFYKGGTLSSRKSMGFGLLDVLELGD